MLGAQEGIGSAAASR